MSSIGGASAVDTDAFLKIASGTFADIETMSLPGKWQHENLAKHMYQLSNFKSNALRD